MSFTPDMLLDDNDAKKNETETTLNEEAPKKEEGPASPGPSSARHYCSLPDLRNSSLFSSSGLELSKPIPRTKEAKCASVVNMLPGPVVSGAGCLPRGGVREVVMGPWLSCPFSALDFLLVL